MNVLPSPKAELATEKAVELACGKVASEQSPTREVRPGREQDVLLSPEIFEISKNE